LIFYYGKSQKAKIGANNLQNKKAEKLATCTQMVLGVVLNHEKKTTPDSEKKKQKKRGKKERKKKPS